MLAEAVACSVWANHITQRNFGAKFEAEIFSELLARNFSAGSLNILLSLSGPSDLRKDGGEDSFDVCYSKVA